MNEQIPESLPREWLPDSLGDDPRVWHDRVHRLMEAAEPSLERLRRRRVPWWTPLAAWWKPTIGLAIAAAAAALVLLSTVQREVPIAPAASPTLAAVAGGGEPAALWVGLDRAANPVLAAVALEREER